MAFLLRSVLVGALWFLAATVATAATIVRVDPVFGSDAFDGSSWSSEGGGVGPMLTIPAAVSVVGADPEGGEVWLKQGVHLLGTTTDAAGSTGIGIRMQSNVAVRGNFEGVETDPTERPQPVGPLPLTTVIDGSVAQAGMPAHHVIQYHQTVHTLLEGVTVRGGSLPNTATEDGRGGGIQFLLADGTNIVESCWIVGNHGTFENNFGAGVLVRGGAPVFRDSLVGANGANMRFGAGLALFSGGRPHFESCTFAGNSASRGAALYFGASDIAGTFDRCVFAGNRSQPYGGAFHVDGGTIEIANSLFAGNRAGSGGAVSLVNPQSAMTVTGTTFAGNSASFGGAIAVLTFGGASPSATVRNSIFSANGIHALYENTAATDFTEIAHNLFHGNTGSDFVSEGSVGVAAADIDSLGDLVATGNFDGDPLFVGGGFTGTWDSVAVTDQIFIDLTDGTASFPTDDLVGMYIRPSISQPLILPIIANTSTTIRTLGEGTILADFASGQTYQVHDFHLQTGSPAIDSGGDYRAESALLGADLDGNYRPRGAAYDIGAYELATDLAAPQMTIRPSVANPVPGQEILFEIGVAGDMPTGTVELFEGAASLGTEVLSDGTATIAVSTLGIGDHELFATYSGDGSNQSATSAPITVTVSEPPGDLMLLR